MPVFEKRDCEGLLRAYIRQSQLDDFEPHVGIVSDHLADRIGNDSACLFLRRLLKDPATITTAGSVSARGLTLALSERYRAYQAGGVMESSWQAFKRWKARRSDAEREKSREKSYGLKAAGRPEGCVPFEIDKGLDEPPDPNFDWSAMGGVVSVPQGFSRLSAKPLKAYKRSSEPEPPTCQKNTIAALKQAGVSPERIKRLEAMAVNLGD